MSAGEPVTGRSRESRNGKWDKAKGGGIVAYPVPLPIMVRGNLLSGCIMLPPAPTFYKSLENAMYYFDYDVRKRAIEEDIRMGLSSYEELEEFEEEYAPDPDEAYDRYRDNLMMESL